MVATGTMEYLAQEPTEISAPIMVRFATIGMARKIIAKWGE